MFPKSPFPSGRAGAAPATPPSRRVRLAQPARAPVGLRSQQGRLPADSVPGLAALAAAGPAEHCGERRRPARRSPWQRRHRAEDASADVAPGLSPAPAAVTHGVGREGAVAVGRAASPHSRRRRGAALPEGGGRCSGAAGGCLGLGSARRRGLGQAVLPARRFLGISEVCVGGLSDRKLRLAYEEPSVRVDRKPPGWLSTVSE